MLIPIIQNHPRSALHHDRPIAVIGTVHNRFFQLPHRLFCAEGDDTAANIRAYDSYGDRLGREGRGDGGGEVPGEAVLVVADGGVEDDVLRFGGHFVPVVEDVAGAHDEEHPLGEVEFEFFAKCAADLAYGYAGGELEDHVVDVWVAGDDVVQMAPFSCVRGGGGKGGRIEIQSLSREQCTFGMIGCTGVDTPPPPTMQSYNPFSWFTSIKKKYPIDPLDIPDAYGAVIRCFSLPRCDVKMSGLRVLVPSTSLNCAEHTLVSNDVHDGEMCNNAIK